MMIPVRVSPGVISRTNGQSHTRTEVVSLNKRHFESPTGCVDSNASTCSTSTNDQNVELGVFITGTRGFEDIEVLFTRRRKPSWWWLARLPRGSGVRGAGVEKVVTASGDHDGASRGVGEGFAGKKGATEHYGGWWKKGCKLLMIWHREGVWGTARTTRKTTWNFGDTERSHNQSAGTHPVSSQSLPPNSSANLFNRLMHVGGSASSQASSSLQASERKCTNFKWVSELRIVSAGFGKQ